MKRLSSILLGTILTVSSAFQAFSAMAADDYAPFKGSGTASDPYQISSAYTLQLLSELVNDPDSAAQYQKASYIQTADIDLKGKDWIPIGDYWDATAGSAKGSTFLGSYNGNYHKITNLNCKADKDKYIGLFGRVSGGTNSIISNLSVYGSVSADGIIGGIIGELYGGSTVKNCSFTGTLGGSYAIGGIAGYIYNGGTVTNCYANGSITASSETKGSSGGLVGGVNAGNGTNSVNAKISNSYFTGTVSGLQCGGVAGYATVADAKPDCTITFENVYYLNSANKGAVAEAAYTGCSSLSETLLKSSPELLGSPFITDEDSVNNGYPIFQWQGKPYQFVGKGTKDAPYQIGCKADLEMMRNLINSEYSSANYRSCYYIQTADLDLNNVLWEPIGVRMVNGQDTSLNFSGHYDGQGHSVHNLNVNRTEKFAGLFGSLNSGGSVENLVADGVVISSAPSAGGITGEICGGNSFVRGCAFIGDVSGASWGTGGVVGTLWHSGNIENCYHNGAVINTVETSTGGIVGRITVGDTSAANDSVKNCYNIGTINAPKTYAGNIAGVCEILTNYESSISIENCYVLKDTGIEAVNGKTTVCEVTALSESLLKKAYEDLGTAYKENTSVDLNGGYPLLSFQSVALRGDVNLDGKVNIADVVALQKHLCCTTTLKKAQAECADISADGKINVIDFTLLKRMLLSGGKQESAMILNKTTAALTLDSTVQLTATILPSSADQTVTWKSADTKVATVSADGLVKAVGTGETEITATSASGSQTATCKILVAKPSISLNKTAITLYPAGTETLAVTTIPSGAAVTWVSDNTVVATVSGGKITAVAAGTANITASVTSNGTTVKATCAVTVSSISIKLNKTATTIYLAGTETLTATVVPSGSAVTWKSSNTAVATVSGGKVTAVAAGSATITATITVNGKSASATCAVTVATPNIKLNRTSLPLCTAGTETLTATVVPSGSAVTWKSSNTAAATVSSGKVTAVAAGSATITASISINGKTYSATCTVTVTQPSIKLNKTSMSKYIGDAETLTATVVPSGTTVTWKSSNTAIATVSGGKVPAIAAGSATITASITVNGKTYSATCAVNVTAPKVTLSATSGSSSDEHVYYSSSTKNFYAGIYNLPTATAVPSCTITWSIASGSGSVSGGKLFINQPGTVVARASFTYQGKTYYADYTYKRTVTFSAGSAFTLRSGPSTSKSSLGSIPKGTNLTVSALDYSDGTYVWGKVTYNGTTGYVALWRKDRSESNGIITV